MIPSTNLTVEEFFQQANWQGLKIVSMTGGIVEVVTEAEEINLDLSLTVEKFFSLHNWQGIIKTNTVANISEVEVQPNYALTMSVREFFQRMPWQGQKFGYAKKTNIASFPKLNSSENTTSNSQLNVNDLSDLL